MTNKEFAAKLIDVATNYKTLYVMGCFGAPMSDANKKRYCNNHVYNRQAKRTKMIQSADKDTFGFDCVCLIKGLLWGWNGDLKKTYGGASYASNNVPDVSADRIITMCNPSTDFSTIEVGEVVWIEGHVGVYVGEGRVIESTPKWTNNVLISYLGNNPKYKKDHYRVWTKHGKLPYITYEPIEVRPTVTPENPSHEDEVSSPTESTTDTFKVGDRVHIVGERYTPVSAKVPNSVKNDYIHIITKTESNSKKVYKGGKECVLLGKKIKNDTTKELAGINTWVAIENLALIPTYRTYTVAQGDSLWGIASKLLGKGARYTEIKTLNGLTSNYIYVGNVLKIPNK